MSKLEHLSQPPLPSLRAVDILLPFKFKLWNLIIFMLSIVFQQLSRNFAHVCFCFRQEVDEHHPRHHTKKGLVQGRRGIVCKVPSVTS